MERRRLPRESLEFFESEDRFENVVARVLGLTGNESRVYLALLEKNASTASQLSRITGIHRTRIYDNLKGLENKGLILSTTHEPKRFVPLPVTIGLRSVLKRIEEAFERRKQEIQSLQTILQKLETRRAPSLTPMYIVSADEILDELRFLLKDVQTRVWVCKKTAGGLLDWSLLKDDLIRMMHSGIDVRFLSDRRLNIGFPTRTIEPIAFSFAIIDSTVLCFLFNEGEKKIGKAMVISNSEFLSFLICTFQQWWDNAD